MQGGASPNAIASRVAWLGSRAGWLVIPLIVIAIVAALAAQTGGLIAVGVVAVLCMAWSLRDPRVGFVILVALASFVNYSAGRLLLELGVVYGWLLWMALVIWWRSAWMPGVELPRGMGVPMVCWALACVFGAIIGLLGGNNTHYLGIQFAGALWPLMSVLMCQALSRKNLIGAGVGLVLLSLAHLVFGLTAIRAAHERLGGVYFTPVPGQVAMLLWAACLLAPRLRWRMACLVFLALLLIHQIFSFTRGYWLGILAGIAVATVLCWVSERPAARASMVRRAGALTGALAAALAVLLVSSTLLGGSSLMQAAGRRFGSSFSLEASSETASNVMRLLEYSQALDSARQAPLTGKGFGFAFVIVDPFLGGRTVDMLVHNYYLYITLKMGLIGLAAFFFLFWRFFRATIPPLRDEHDWLSRTWLIAAIAMTVQVLVICLTNYSLNDANTGATFAFLWAGAWAILSERRRRRASVTPAARAVPLDGA